MINISINGETVIIREETAIKDLIPLDAYPLEIDGRVALAIPKELDTPKDIEKMNLYVAGVLTSDKQGYIETVEDPIVFEGLTWKEDWQDYFGVYVEGDFSKYDAAAGIKIYFGRR